MTKVSQKDMTQIQNLIEQLDEAFESLEQATFEYNELIAELNEAKASVAGRIEDYMHSLSDEWQESEGGEAYQEWLEQWEEEAEDADSPMCDHSEAGDLCVSVEDFLNS